jgi:hypothetical protein
MFDLMRGVRRLQRRTWRSRTQQTMRQMGTMGSNAGGAGREMLATAMAGAGSAMRALPVRRRRQRPNPAVLTAPIVAVAGLVAAAGLLLWDDRRRAAARRRLDEVARAVSPNATANRRRTAPPVASGAPGAPG